MLKSGLASNGVYRAISVTRDAVVSYTAFPPLPVTWRYISVALSLGCLHRTLSGILPCEARTFLVCMSFDNAAATIHPTWFFMVLLYGNVTSFSTLFDFTDCFSGLIRFRSQFFNKYFFFSSNPNQTALFLIFS